MRPALLLSALVAGCAAAPTMQSAYPSATSAETCRAAHKADMDGQGASVVTGALLGGLIGAGVGANAHVKQADARLRMCLARIDGGGGAATARLRPMRRSCVDSDSAFAGGAGYCVGR